MRISHKKLKKVTAWGCQSKDYRVSTTMAQELKSTETETHMTPEQVQSVAKAKYDESIRDKISLDEPIWYQAANDLIDDNDSDIIEVIHKSIIESAESRSFPESTSIAIADCVCDLIKKRLLELSGELLMRHVNRDILEELVKGLPAIDAEMQARITEFIGTEPNLIATATTRADIEAFNKQALELLAVIEATEYHPRVTFRTPNQEYTFDASEPASMLEQMGDTDKMIIRCRDSHRKPTKISVMMSTPSPPRLKITPSKLPGLTIGDVVARIPRHWDGKAYESVRPYFGLTASPHITVEFTD